MKKLTKQEAEARAKAEVEAEARAERHRASSRKWREKFPLRARETRRLSSEKKRKTPEWKEYMRNYMVKYHKKNMELQHMYSVPGNIKCGVRQCRKFGYEYAQTYKQLLSVGWTVDTDLHVSHKVPLRLLIQINKNLSKIICFHPKIIEVATKVENHRATRREVTNETWMLAAEFETMFPDELKGLADLVKTYIGRML